MIVTWLCKPLSMSCVTDIDECENSDNCLYGTCVNRIGSYNCQCPPDYDLNAAGNGCVGKYGMIHI